jgi:hypothetical protein
MNATELNRSALRTDGVGILNTAIPQTVLHDLLILCSAIRRQWFHCDPLTGRPGADKNKAVCLRHVNHPSYFKKDLPGLRLMLESCVSVGIIAALRKSWGSEPVFRSTTLFFSPRQDQPATWHRDSQFEYPDPTDERTSILHRAAVGGGSVAQVQLALIDSDDLQYIPGSHRRWDAVEELRIRLSDDPQVRCSDEMPGAVRCRLSAGDAVIFDPSGIHRGRYLATRSRMTLMVTFVQETSKPMLDRLSFQSWFLNPGYLDGLSHHATTVYGNFIKRYRDLWRDVGCTEHFHSGR